jgi:pilus assembly protein CpaC
MSTRFFTTFKRLTLAGALAWCTLLPNLAPAQIRHQEGFEVQETVRSIDLASGTSRKLVFEHDVPELYVETPDVIRVTPVSPNELVVTGLKPGVSALTVSDSNKQLKTITVNVTLDVRKLELALAQHFPDSAIRVHALQTGVILKGSVARADDVEQVMLVARDFFPTNIVNHLQVHTPQTVAIEVKVYEVSRTKLRNLGVDWSVLGSDVNIVSGFADLIQNFSDSSAAGQNMRVGISSGSTDFNLLVNALEKRNVAKLMAQPTLITQNGRPAEFLSGVEVPIAVASGLGTNSIEFRAAGTKLDFVPIIHGEGELTLEIRAEVSEVANDLGGDTGVPGFRVRRVNTGVPMRAGQTLALAGDYSEVSDGETRGAPGLIDKPWWGVPFRNTRNNRTETELVFLITPRFVSPVDAAAVPTNMPGRSTMDPSNREMFINGYLEVPRCNDDCPIQSPYASAPTTSPLRNDSFNLNDAGQPQLHQHQPEAPAQPSSAPAAKDATSRVFRENLNDQANGSRFGFPQSQSSATAHKPSWFNGSGSTQTRR